MKKNKTMDELAARMVRASFHLKKLKKRNPQEAFELQEFIKDCYAITQTASKNLRKQFSFDEYQVAMRQTAFYPNVGDNWTFPALGLAGETGEVCDKIKKIIRDDKGKLTKKNREFLKKELGDVLFYVAAQAWELGFKLSEVAEGNVEKTLDRKRRNKLAGSGDER